jgi:hypothetical protein
VAVSRHNKSVTRRVRVTLNASLHSTTMSDRRAEQCCTFTSQFEDPSISEEVKRLLVRLCEDQPELLADLRYGAELYEEQEEESGYMVCEGSGVDQEREWARLAIGWML